MTRIITDAVIRAAPDVVWRIVSDLAAQPDWMRDATAIRFISDQKSGAGTVMDCETRIGPLRLTDRLVVTEWDEGRAIGIRHDGVISGSGHFTLRATPEGTRFSWDENLRFPWWLGGPVTGAAARPVLAATWRRDITRLTSIAEHAAGLGRK